MDIVLTTLMVWLAWFVLAPFIFWAGVVVVMVAYTGVKYGWQFVVDILNPPKNMKNPYDPKM